MANESAASKKLPPEYLIEKINELPTLPTIVYELSQLINDPMSSTTDIESVMEKDQALTTKVLKMINSAYYAIPGGVTQLARAIAYLGFDTVNQLVLSTSILKTLDVKGPYKFDINQFWIHAMGVGMASEVIAKHAKHKMPSDLFTCGLVHDIGKIALCIIDPELLVSISQSALERGLSFHEVEVQMDTKDHTEIGALVTKKWNLPLLIQTSVQYHHQPDPLRRGGISTELSRNVDIVYLANLLVHALKFGNSGHQKILGAPKPVLERLNIDAAKLPIVLADIKKALANAEGFIKIIQGN